MSPVYYAGGTAPKDVCARDYIDKLKARGIRAFFLEHKKALPDLIRQIAIPPTVVLLMGARDPLLDYFANFVSNFIIYYDQGI
jgi:UDP-N-acetylmuramate--alanine ligase